MSEDKISLELLGARVAALTAEVAALRRQVETLIGQLTRSPPDGFGGESSTSEDPG